MSQWNDEINYALSVQTMLSPKDGVCVWRPEGLNKDIPIPYIHSYDALRQQSDAIHVYPGLGEEPRASLRAVRALSEVGLPSVAVVLPFHHLEPTEADILRTVIEAPHAVMEHINLRAGRGADTRTGVIGSSQGGGVVAMSSIAAPEKFEEVVLSEPVGFTHGDFTGIASYIWRLGVRNNLRREQLTDPWGWLQAGNELSRRLAYDALHWRLLRAKFNIATGFDLTEDFIEKVVPARDVAVFANTRDPLFPAACVLESFAKYDREDLVHIRNSSHTNLNMRAGIRDLKVAAEWLKATRENRKIAPAHPNAQGH